MMSGASVSAYRPVSTGADVKAANSATSQGPASGFGLAMDMAFEGDETRGLACLLGFQPVVPPNPQQLKPWRLDKVIHKERNHIERLFSRLKSFRIIFTVTTSSM